MDTTGLCTNCETTRAAAADTEHWCTDSEQWCEDCSEEFHSYNSLPSAGSEDETDEEAPMPCEAHLSRFGSDKKCDNVGSFSWCDDVQGNLHVCEHCHDHQILMEKEEKDDLAAEEEEEVRSRMKKKKRSRMKKKKKSRTKKKRLTSHRSPSRSRRSSKPSF